MTVAAFALAAEHCPDVLSFDGNIDHSMLPALLNQLQILGTSTMTAQLNTKVSSQPPEHYITSNNLQALPNIGYADGKESNAESNALASINTLLTWFNNYGLDDLNNANLMNRVDSKFILPMSFLPALLWELRSDYRVLDIDKKRCFSYHNQYFDTPNMDLYHDHHNGKLNRYKVRSRCYVDTATEYLEVKLKNNQSRTVKTRIKLDNNANESSICHQFIQQEMNGKNSNLDVTQQSGYRRISLANEEKAERLTLDFDLWYKNKRGNNQVTLPHFFIAELKQNKKSKHSPFYQLMTKLNFFPTSFSKYCIGCALLYPGEIKTNRFKAILTQIQKFNRITAVPSIERN